MRSSFTTLYCSLWETPKFYRLAFVQKLGCCGIVSSPSTGHWIASRQVPVLKGLYRSGGERLCRADRASAGPAFDSRCQPLVIV
jgi:hypothetical protein